MPMRRRGAKKIKSLCTTCRLLFLPSSTSALMAVFLAGLTFGFYTFSCCYFLLFFLCYCFYCSYFYLFTIGWCFLCLLLFFLLLFLFILTSTEVVIGACSSVEKLDELDDVLVVCSVPTSPHLQALRVLSIAVVPCPSF